MAEVSNLREALQQAKTQEKDQIRKTKKLEKELEFFEDYKQEQERRED